MSSALGLSTEVDKTETDGGVIHDCKQKSDHFVIVCSDQEIEGLCLSSQGSPNISSNSDCSKTRNDNFFVKSTGV